MLAHAEINALSDLARTGEWQKIAADGRSAAEMVDALAAWVAEL